MTRFLAARPPTQPAGNGAVAELSLTPGASGLLVTYRADSPRPDASGAAIVRGDGTAVCSFAAGHLHATGAALGGGFALVVAFRIGLVATPLAGPVAGCGAGATAPSAIAGDADELAAGAGAEGTAGVAATAGGGTTLTAAVPRASPARQAAHRQRARRAARRRLISLAAPARQRSGAALARPLSLPLGRGAAPPRAAPPLRAASGPRCRAGRGGARHAEGARRDGAAAAAGALQPRSADPWPLPAADRRPRRSGTALGGDDTEMDRC